MTPCPHSRDLMARAGRGSVVRGPWQKRFPEGHQGAGWEGSVKAHEVAACCVCGVRAARGHRLGFWQEVCRVVRSQALEADRTPVSANSSSVRHQLGINHSQTSSLISKWSYYSTAEVVEEFKITEKSRCLPQRRKVVLQVIIAGEAGHLKMARFALWTTMWG